MNCTITRIAFIAVFIFSGNTFSQSWGPVGVDTVDGVSDLIVYNNELLAATGYNPLVTAPGHGISKWNGSAWSGFTLGIDSGSAGGNYVRCLDTVNGNLYAGGLFSSMNLVSANNIAMWNGSNWTPLGIGTNGEVLSMAYYAGELYVGGKFTLAGGVPVNNIAKWNGSTWSAVGTGITNLSYYWGVLTLCVYNNELYAGGDFTSPGNYIAKWNGSAWSALGTGMDDAIYTLKVYNNELYIGGFFFNVNSSPCKFVARWNGSWLAMTPNNNANVYCLEVINGNLYTAGTGTTLTSFQSWNGSSWTSIYTGIPGQPCSFISHGIFAIAKYGADIYLGGSFWQICNEPGNYIIYAPQNVGVNEITQQSSVTVYPNPSSGIFTVTSEKEITAIEIYNMLGEKIYKSEMRDVKYEIDLSAQAKGVYFIKIESGENVSTQKMAID